MMMFKIILAKCLKIAALYFIHWDFMDHFIRSNINRWILEVTYLELVGQRSGWGTWAAVACWPISPVRLPPAHRLLEVLASLTLRTPSCLRRASALRSRLRHRHRCPAHLRIGYPDRPSETSLHPRRRSRFYPMNRSLGFSPGYIREQTSC